MQPGIAFRIALRMEKRLTLGELRAHCDRKTGGELDPYELDKVTQWVEEHPAYQALPEDSEDI